MKHLHHIVPCHMGGSDDPSNLYECTPDEHAELHFALYLEHGDWRDWRAARGLAKLGGHPIFTGQKHTDEARAKMSKKCKGLKKTEAHKAKIGQANKGKKRSAEFKKNASEKLKAYYQTPEGKEKMRLSLLKRKANKS